VDLAKDPSARANLENPRDRSTCMFAFQNAPIEADFVLLRV